MIMWFYPPFYADFPLTIQRQFRAMYIRGYGQALTLQTFHNNA